MPTFVIITPDGKQMEVTGPEGSTKEEALEVAHEKWTAQFPRKIGKELTEESVREELASRGMGEKYLAGAGAPAERAAYRMREMFGPLRPEGENARQMREMIQQQSPEAKLGAATSEAALAALPVGRGFQLASKATSPLAKALIASGTGAVTGGTLGAVTAPKGKVVPAAVGGALGGAVTPGVGAAVKAAPQAMTKLPQALKAIAKVGGGGAGMAGTAKILEDPSAAWNYLTNPKVLALGAGLLMPRYLPKTSQSLAIGAGEEFGNATE